MIKGETKIKKDGVEVSIEVSGSAMTVMPELIILNCEIIEEISKQTQADSQALMRSLIDAMPEALDEIKTYHEDKNKQSN